MPRKFSLATRRVTVGPALRAAVIVAMFGLAVIADNPDTPAEQQLFNQRNLDGWRVANEHYFDQHGQVSVDAGRLVLEAGEPATGVVWTKDFPRDNYEVEIEASRLAGSDIFCGVTFPVGPSYCTFVAGGWGGDATGLSNLDDLAAIENDTTGQVDFQEGRSYRIRIRVDDRVRVWVDDDRVVDVSRRDHKFSIWWEQEPMRPFGVATWKTKSCLRKVVLRRVP